MKRLVKSRIRNQSFLVFRGIYFIYLWNLLKKFIQFYCNTYCYTEIHKGLHTWWHTTLLRHSRRRRHRVIIRNITWMPRLRLNNLNLSLLAKHSLHESLNSSWVSTLQTITSVLFLYWYLYLLRNFFCLTLLRIHYMKIVINHNFHIMHLSSQVQVTVLINLSYRNASHI